jgi:hypothetical protein
MNFRFSRRSLTMTAQMNQALVQRSYPRVSGNWQRATPRIVAGVAASLVVLLGTVASTDPAWAHPGCGPAAGGQPKQKVDDSYRRPVGNLNLADFPMQPQRGGQVTAGKWHYFEVVYAPQETRIYVYSPSQRPLYTKDVTGEVAMEVFSSGQTARVPVRFVQQQTSTNDAGYLSVPVDLSQVQDGDMQATFKLKILTQDGSYVEFKQMFALYEPVRPVAEPQFVRLPPTYERR